jgi:hypothetical protein
LLWNAPKAGEPSFSRIGRLFSPALNPSSPQSATKAGEASLRKASVLGWADSFAKTFEK